MPKRRRESDESKDEVYDDGMTNSVFEFKMEVTEDIYQIQLQLSKIFVSGDSFGNQSHGTLTRISTF